MIDSWPVLEWLLGNQPVARRFSEFLERNIAGDARLLISRINYGEVIYMLPKKVSQTRLADTYAALSYLPLEIVSADDRYVDEAVALKTNHACSYADCFAVALAMRLSAPLVTGDRELLPLQHKGLVTLEWLGA